MNNTKSILQKNGRNLNQLLKELKTECDSFRIRGMSNKTKEIKKLLREIRDYIKKNVFKNHNLEPDILNNFLEYVRYLKHTIKKVCKPGYCYYYNPTEYAYNEICVNLYETIEQLESKIHYFYKLSTLPLGINNTITNLTILNQPKLLQSMGKSKKKKRKSKDRQSKKTL